jgi:hypothetical protein
VAGISPSCWPPSWVSLNVSALSLSLDDFISARQGNEHNDASQNPANPESEYGHLSKAERIAAFRERTRAGAERVRTSNLKAVHLLSPEEIISLFGDIVAGLAFLVRLFWSPQWGHVSLGQCTA